MTNKPMLSVERADFEKEVQAKSERFQPDFRRYGDHPEADYKCATNQWAWELWQKRASMSKSAAQHQGEPVAIEGERAAYEQWQWRRDWPIEQLAGARLGEYFKRKFLDPEKYESERFNDGLAVWLARATLPVQPAPVAVVMPERMADPGMVAGMMSKWAQDWNEALAEVARLNGVKP